MKTIEYRTIDKSTWADGPWHHEPDKRQWQDAATGLFCLVLRNQFLGSLNGYVGVPPDHPAYGLHYDGITDAEVRAKLDAWREDTRRWAAAGYPPLGTWRAKHPVAKGIDDPFPGIGEKLRDIEVHGGLTYCGESNLPDRAHWNRLRASIKKGRARAARFPRGDHARFIQFWQKAAEDYDTYARQVMATMIGCDMEEGEPPALWFFGFDCGHAFDVQPGLDATMEELGSATRRLRLPEMPEETYRDLAYVEAQVTELAKQLAALYVPIEIGADHA